MNGRAKYVAVLVGGALLVGTPAVAASGPSQQPMSPSQARSAFRKAVCPLNETFMVLEKVEKAPVVNWETLQAALMETGDMQLRTAAKLGHPKRPWPANVASYMPAMADLDLTQAGANYTLAAAGSFEEYQTLLKALQKDISAPLKAEIKSFVKARKIVHKRLGLPKDACA